MKKIQFVLVLGLCAFMMMGMASLTSAAQVQDWVNGSFESPDVTGSDVVWGETPGWYTYDRYGIGFTQPGVMEAPGLATDGTQVGVAREGWMAQHWILADGRWPGTVEGNRYTFSVDLGIDAVSPTQGLRPRTCALKIVGTPDMSYWADLAVLNLDLNNLAPGTMQRFSVSFDCLAANNNVGFTAYVGIDQTEANSMVLLDNAVYDASPIVPEPASLISLFLGVTGMLGVAARKRR